MIPLSNLKAYGYDPASQTLAVQFQNGTVYHYADVPQAIADGMKDAESKGSFFARKVRTEYRGERITEEPAPQYRPFETGAEPQHG